MALKKTKSQKIQAWSTKDIVENVFTYLANIILIALLFVGTIFLQNNTNNGEMSVAEYFKDLTRFLQFIILLLLIVGLIFIRIGGICLFLHYRLVFLPAFYIIRLKVFRLFEILLT